MSCENYPIPGFYSPLGLGINPVSLNPIANAIEKLTKIKFPIDLDARMATGMNNVIVVGGSVSAPGFGGLRGEMSFDKGGNPYGTSISGEGGFNISLGDIPLGSSTITISGDEVTFTLPNGTKGTYNSDTIKSDVERAMKDFTKDPAKAAAAGDAAKALLDGIKEFEGGAEKAANAIRDYIEDHLPDPCDNPGEDVIPVVKNPVSSPLVLDLDGDGIELTSLNGTSTFFDLDVNGFAEATGWVAPDDALLALDVDGDGRIENGSELFGDQTGHDHGFLALAEYDDNGDGVIDANDAVFDDLLIWQDLNGDGVNQENETRSLTEAGITSISVNATATDYEVAGNEVLWESSFTWADGTTGVIADAFFATDTGSTTPILPDGFTHHSEAFILPVLSGSGEVASSIVAYSLDQDLRAQAHSLLEQLSNGDVSSFFAAFEDFLLKWAGVNDVDPASRGIHVDARHLELMEKLVGSGFAGGVDVNPGLRQGEDLKEAFEELVQRFAIRFIEQAPTASDALELMSAEDHPLKALSDIMEVISASNETVSADLADVLSGLQSAVDAGNITASNAAAAIRLMQVDFSKNHADADVLLQTAMQAAGLDKLSEFYLQLVHGVEYDIAVGTDDANTLSASGKGYLVGHGGNDSIVGGQDGNVIIGGKGNDNITGGVGKDEYIYNLGDGSDVIYDKSHNSSINDKLTFTDLNAGDVTFSQNAGQDLVIALSNGETVTIIDHFSSDRYDIELIQFADGTVLNSQQIRDKSVADQKASGAVRGSNFAENYVHTQGDGSYTIWDKSHGSSINDKLTFTDVNAGDVTFSQNSGKDLVITLSNGETVTIIDHFSSDRYDMELIQFADGTVFDGQQIRDKTVADQKASGAVGGSYYAENYVHTQGDGSYSIWDKSHGSSINDKLTFTDVNAGDVTFSQNAGQDLVITLSNGETVTVIDHFRSDLYDMELIQFADGTVLNGQQIRDKALSGGSGEDTIIGFSTNDVINGGAGNDVLTGGGGADEFVFETSFGNDTITDFADGSDLIRVDIVGLGFDDLVITQNGNDSEVDIAGHGTITLSGVNSSALTVDDFLF